MKEMEQLERKIAFVKDLEKICKSMVNSNEGN